MAGICPQCERLLRSIQSVVEGLNDAAAGVRTTFAARFVHVHQELELLQTANSSLLSRAPPFDNGTTPAPLDFRKGVAMVVSNCTEVIEGLQEGILLEDATPQIRALETARLAALIAVRGLDIATSLAAAEKSGDSPPYATTSINDEILIIKARLAEDRDRDINGLQGVVLAEFLDCLQHYAASQAGILGPASMGSITTRNSTIQSPNHPGADTEPRASTTFEDLYQPGHPIPAYSAVDVPAAPQRIHLRHISRLPGLEFEPLNIVFDPQARVPRVAIADLYSRVRFFNIRGSPSNKPLEDVATLSSNVSTTGMHLTLSRTGPPRLAVLTDGPIGPDPGEMQHDGENFVKNVLYIFDYGPANTRVAQIKRAGVRPFSFSPDGAFLAVKGPRGRVEILSGSKGLGLAVVRSHTEEVTDAQFTSDGASMVSMSRDGTLRVTSTATWHGMAKLEVAEWRNPVFLALPLTPSKVIMSVWGRKVYLWNPDTGALTKWDLDAAQGDEHAGSGGVAGEGWPLAASPDLKYLCCRTDQGADVREVASGRVLCRMGFGAGFATAAAWSADSKTLALGRMVGGVFGQGTGRVDFWEVID